MKANNLIRESFWNSYFVITSNRGGGYELDNIIIYGNNGELLLETGCGWFNESNNYTGSINVNNGILKINAGSEEKHKKEQHNFIVKTKESYKDGYTLYIYYKNVNYKPIEIVKESLFIELKYQLFDNVDRTYSKAIGQSKKFSDAVYNELRKEIEKTNGDCYKYDNNISELEQHLKDIKKLMKKYEKTKELEKEFSIEKFIDGTSTNEENNIEIFRNNKKMIKEG